MFEPEETFSTGNTSDLSLNESNSRCHGDPCQNGGVCQEISNVSFCICSVQYTGATCGSLMDLCVDNPCVNGQCVTGNGSYLCLCESGYTGYHCESDVNECMTNVCPGSECYNVPGDYRCVCPQCQFGLCIYTGSTQSCQCFPGFIGKNCSQEVNECDDASSCRHGTCTDYVNGVKCNCDDGYTGRRCDVEIIHPCDGDPCDCGACVIIGNDFLCECPLTRTGKRCENFEEVYNSILDPDDLTTQFCDVSTCEIRLRTKCEFSFINYFHSIKNSYSNISIKSIKINKDSLIKMSVACNTNTGIQTLSQCKVAIALIDIHSISDILFFNLACDGTDCSNSAIAVDSLVHLSSTPSGNVLSCLPILINRMDTLLVDTSRSQERYIPTPVVDVLYKMNRAEDSLLQNFTKSLIVQIKFLACLDYSRLCDISNVDTMVCVHITSKNDLLGTSPRPSESVTLTPSSTSANAAIYRCNITNCVHGYCPEPEVSPYCSCEVGFTGQHCDVSMCDALNCRNCYMNTANGIPLCLCDSGSHGDGCNISGIACDNFPCLHGNCELDKYLIPHCECHMKFTGKYCETKISSCDIFTCFHGNCSIDEYGFPLCNCDVGFTGNHCQYIEKYCDTIHCIHGNCTTKDFDVPFCSCLDGYTGRLCEQLIPNCNAINCIYGDCLQNGSCRCHAGYDGTHCDQNITDPKDDDSGTGTLFDYVFWSMIVIIALLLISTMTMIACVRVKRSRGEFLFHDLRRNDNGEEVRPRLINSRDIHEDLRRGFYLSPTIDLGSECQMSLSTPSIRTFHLDVLETDNGVDSDRTGSSDGYRRYSVPDDGHLSMHDLSEGRSSQQHYDIPPPTANQFGRWATDIHTVLRYADLQVEDDIFSILNTDALR
ncbi:protein crumbs-like [Pecten maximus]|uniref:protein crumbs-like n=1 Tax=Pecten maximus TaxID=6579 RepID=UPI00145855CD|nr:protein crumbs-like [Pecten maximus]